MDRVERLRPQSASAATLVHFASLAPLAPSNMTLALELAKLVRTNRSTHTTIKLVRITTAALTSAQKV